MTVHFESMMRVFEESLIFFIVLDFLLCVINSNDFMFLNWIGPF